MQNKNDSQKLFHYQCFYWVFLGHDSWEQLGNVAVKMVILRNLEARVWRNKYYRF